MPPPIEPRFLPLVGPSPAKVPGGLSFSALSAGGGHTCGLERGTGAAFCWGPGQSGQLGNGANESSAAPVAVVGGRYFTAIAAGVTYSCGLEASGAAWCW